MLAIVDAVSFLSARWGRPAPELLAMRERPFYFWYAAMQRQDWFDGAFRGLLTARAVWAPSDLVDEMQERVDAPTTPALSREEEARRAIARAEEIISVKQGQKRGA